MSANKTTGRAAAGATPSGGRDMREVIREETYMRGRILAFLAEGPHTVPEIAAELGAPTHEAMFWVMGMRRYGWVREAGGAEDGYFRYQATSRETR